MIQSITIQSAIEKICHQGIPVIDIRSPQEYNKGHIPGSISLPLFSDEQRAVVGTIYHKEGRKAAILKGFDLTGPKWSSLIQQALLQVPEQKVILHCWRGGMRSEAMAWALNLYGFEVEVIAGGYKAFRRWTRTRFEDPYHLIVLAGKTGSNKTGILEEIARQGAQVIDLEGLACHHGSAYGSKGQAEGQPTQEQFENNLSFKLYELDKNRQVWIEDESITIGRCAIPQPLYRQLCTAPSLEIEVPLSDRIRLLDEQYGVLDKVFLEEATLRIKKRLGPNVTQAALEDIRSGKMREFIRRVLVYYDKAYSKSRKKPSDKPWILTVPLTENRKVNEIAEQLLILANGKGIDP